MQKLVKLCDPTMRDIAEINDSYLNNGWYVKQMLTLNSNLIILFEKETRKEKLEALNDLSNG